ncbi:hypothetical protein [Nostoc sp. NMS4]|uniref:hypothetical protein n=1 Tax=Nostoc sp. NMS4 TaxID=2815390 RepID=UPI0025DCE0BA|nr:hypothetical protein [Nostoc sp. NMS4]
MPFFVASVADVTPQPFLLFLFSQPYTLGTISFLFLFNYMYHPFSEMVLERISVEMVFRSLYFFHRARSHNLQLQLIPWLVEHQRSIGLVKAIPQRHRRNASRSLYIWAEALT